MPNLFGSLDIDIWDFIGIWRLEFEISEYLNTRDSISKDDLSIGYRTVKFHAWVVRFYSAAIKGCSPSSVLQYLLTQRVRLIIPRLGKNCSQLYSVRNFQL
jgi:hypothetical protein